MSANIKEGAVIKEGYITKQGSKVKSWKKRLFVLRDDKSLAYFSTKDIFKQKKKGEAHVHHFRENANVDKNFCIEVLNKDKSKSLFLSFDTINDLQLWISYFIKIGAAHLPPVKAKKRSASVFGGKKEEKVSSINPLDELTTTDFALWNTQTVALWLSKVMLDATTKASDLYGANFAPLDGEALQTMDGEALKKLGIDNFAHRFDLLNNLALLRQKRYFSLSEFNTFTKLLNMLGKSATVTVDTIIPLAKNLSDASDLKCTYLSTSSMSSNTVLSAKLVITEILHTVNEKKLRSFISPLMSKIPKLTSEFGMFHTALIIGPWYMEWTNSAICIPRTVQSSMALLSADIDDLAVCSENMEQVVGVLADTVAEWNSYYEYNKFSGKDDVRKSGNCQDFVDCILDKLNVKIKWSGSMAIFLKKMRESGVCDIVFYPPDEAFKQKFNMAGPVKFAKHAELDMFVMHLLAVEPKFAELYNQEWKLLKSFDRGFWLRFKKQPDNAAYAPVATKEGCPYKDPSLTKSYM